ncbi:primase [Microbacterium mangrovi]|uniref:Primase n=1 Tax=Microbacterium mangrovi TaxID=1348253 RepID=A0A0B2AA32_9MICO|nr:DUF3027 domain-containing protein [Microbacterium mangrovi]KHK98613.1 primase [Microbacterium mangrovi]
MTSTPDSDALAVAAHDVALAALHEITTPASVGEAAGYGVEADGTVSLRFVNRLPGYPGWFWTVSIGQVEDAEPTVLEAELLPGDDALLAPDWVPWADRLADYHAHQAELAAAAAEAEADDDEDDESDEDADDEFDGDDLDDEDSDDEFDRDDEDHEDDLDVDDLHDDDDVDGVDIDALGEAEPQLAQD